MPVAWGKFRPRIADADDGATVKDMVWQTFGFHPATVDETVFVQLAIAVLASEFLVFAHRENGLRRIADLRAWSILF